jgi:lysozyme family protein
MADFYKALHKTVLAEGRYSNHPNDSGGATYMGIARNYHPKWEGWKIIDTYSDKNSDKLFKDVKLNYCVAAFYRDNFWDKICGTLIYSQIVAEKIFDIAVNMGYIIASKLLQRSMNLLNRDEKLFLNLVEDGFIGSVTIGVVNKYFYNNEDEIHLQKLITILQGNAYAEIATKNETQENFLRGWLNRLHIEIVPQ